MSFPKIGDCIRHIKRGSLYMVVGRAKIHSNAKDDQLGVFEVMNNDEGVTKFWITPHVLPVSIAIDPIFSIPLIFQISGDEQVAGQFFLIYRHTISGSFWARPEREFTADRFAVVPE